MRDNSNDFEIKENVFIGYCKGSETIRQFPQNYLIAYYIESPFPVWVIDSDSAVSEEIVLAVQLGLITDSNKFLRDGQKVVNGIKKVIEKYDIQISEKDS